MKKISDFSSLIKLFKPKTFVMPVKIVDNTHGSTSINHGTIKKHDVSIMTKSFKKEVGLTAIPPRVAIAKKYSFYFTKDQLLELLKNYEANEHLNALEIAIAVQLSDIVVKCGNGNQFNESDSMAVIVSMVNKDEKIPMNGVDDLVLINGYNDNEPHLLGTPCCPGSKPPPFD